MTGNQKVNDQIYRSAKASALNRSSTELEDMYLISSIDGKIKGKQVAGTSKLAVDYNNSLKKAIRENPRNTLIAVHNHPYNLPPSSSDLVSAQQKGYKFGVVSCHDGKVFIYDVSNASKITSQAIDRKIKRYMDTGHNQNDATIKALDSIRKSHGINWREL